VSESVAQMVAGSAEKHLSLVFKPPEGPAVQDPVAVTLEIRTEGMARLGMDPAPGKTGPQSVRRQMKFLRAEQIGTFTEHLK